QNPPPICPRAPQPCSSTGLLLCPAQSTPLCSHWLGRSCEPFPEWRGARGENSPVWGSVCAVCWQHGIITELSKARGGAGRPVATMGPMSLLGFSVPPPGDVYLPYFPDNWGKETHLWEVSFPTLTEKSSEIAKTNPLTPPQGAPEVLQATDFVPHGFAFPDPSCPPPQSPLTTPSTLNAMPGC
ncbi:hypothetical protein AB205_0036030, partial [Aquarana catesbeiana]